MNIKAKIVFLGLVAWIGFNSPLSVLPANAEETLGEEVQRDAKWLYDKGKELGGQFGSWVGEKAPEVIEGVKEKAPEVAEDIKEALPEVGEKIKSGVSQASEAISEYREGQEDEFMDWFEDQTGTGGDLEDATDADDVDSTDDAADTDDIDDTDDTSETIAEDKLETNTDGDDGKSETDTTETEADAEAETEAVAETVVLPDETSQAESTEDAESDIAADTTSVEATPAASPEADKATSVWIILVVLACTGGLYLSSRHWR